MLQLLQLVGAVLVLAGFGLNQRGVLSSSSSTYLTLNFFGAGVLAVLALESQQWGFLLLEGAWSIIAFVGLISRDRRRTVVEEGAAPVDLAHSMKGGTQL